MRGIGQLFVIVTAYSPIRLPWDYCIRYNPSLQIAVVMIAVSIVWVGVENIVPKPTRRWLAALFGLIHGVGFSSVLGNLVAGIEPTAIEIPALLGFNVGVELGQLIIVLAVYPWFSWPDGATGALVERACFVAITGFGLLWSWNELV